MLYNLGRMNAVSGLVGYLAGLGVLLFGFVGACVLLSVAARIGDLIIGW